MSRRDYRVSLLQMLEHIEEASALVQTRRRECLDTERVVFWPS